VKFTIDRATWLRGQYVSRLLRSSDGKMCCIGQVCIQSGIKPDAIRDLGVVINLDGESREKYQAAVGLAFRADAAYCINDDRKLSEEEREEKLTAHFAKFDHEIQFIN
jgi:hypothetical protein